MVGIPALWLPIVLAAVIVFVASSVIHMVLPWHKHDFGKLPDEDGVMDALGRRSIPPGEYMFPFPEGDMKVMRSEAFKAKALEGPMGMLTVFPPPSGNNPFAMGRQLTLWFVYCLVVGVFAAYIAGRALQPGADYMVVQRFAGCTAFVGYTLAGWQRSIWYRQRWSTSLKNTIDGLIYGLLTGGTFGWLWPG